MTVFVRYVRTEVVSIKKKLRFQMKLYMCGQGLRTKRVYLQPATAGWRPSIYYRN